MLISGPATIYTDTDLNFEVRKGAGGMHRWFLTVKTNNPAYERVIAFSTRRHAYADRAVSGGASLYNAVVNKDACDIRTSQSRRGQHGSYWWVVTDTLGKVRCFSLSRWDTQAEAEDNLEWFKMAVRQNEFLRDESEKRRYRAVETMPEDAL